MRTLIGVKCEGSGYSSRQYPIVSAKVIKYKPTVVELESVDVKRNRLLFV